MTTPSPISDQAVGEPIPMLLFCPKCGTQHIDAPKWERDPHDMEQGLICTWSNPPHKSHLCHGCGNIWRPADIATTGVADIKTIGKADTWCSTAPTTGSAPVAWRIRVQNGGDSWVTESEEHACVARRLGDIVEPMGVISDAAPASPAAGVLADEQIARAIWAIRREDEDRCDMELEDMGADHSVWKEAQAISALFAASMGGDRK